MQVVDNAVTAFWLDRQQ